MGMRAPRGRAGEGWNGGDEVIGQASESGGQLMNTVDSYPAAFGAAAIYFCCLAAWTARRILARLTVVLPFGIRSLYPLMNTSRPFLVTSKRSAIGSLGTFLALPFEGMRRLLLNHTRSARD